MAVTRSTRWAVVALLAAALTLRATAATAGPPSGAKTVPDAPYPDEFKARVQAEVERGAKALLARLTEANEPLGSNEHAMGERALVLLTLLKCGIPKETPAIQQAFAGLRALRPKLVYDVGVFLMALCAQYDGASDPFAQEVVDAGGGRAGPAPIAADLEPANLAWVKSGAKFLLDAQHEVGVVREVPSAPPPGKPPKGKAPVKTGEKPKPLPKAEGWGYGAPDEHWADVSNTQYALLGLKAASRCGFAVPESAWAAALSLLLAWQQSSGSSVTLKANETRGRDRVEWDEGSAARGFGYSRPHDPSGGRTTAGAVGLILCASALRGTAYLPPERETQARIAIRDAFAWMQAQYSVEYDPGRADERQDLLKNVPEKLRSRLPPDFANFDPWYCAYLYSLERMGVLAHVRFIGPHDWYLEGAEWILKRRAGSTGPLAYLSDTDDCFQLLFLRRASFHTTTPVITPADPPAASGGGTRDDGNPPTGK